MTEKLVVKQKRTSYAQGWKLYPFSMAGHHAQGAAVPAAVHTGDAGMIAGAAIWTGLYIAYQGLSVLRKQDSPGLDIADFLAGFAAGAIGVAAFLLL